MAYRIVSYHRRFFSPHQLAGVSRFFSSTVKLNYDVKDNEDFGEKVLKSDKPVVVDFHAT